MRRNGKLRNGIKSPRFIRPVNLTLVYTRTQLLNLTRKKSQWLMNKGRRVCEMRDQNVPDWRESDKETSCTTRSWTSEPCCYAWVVFPNVVRISGGSFVANKREKIAVGRDRDSSPSTRGYEMDIHFTGKEIYGRNPKCKTMEMMGQTDAETHTTLAPSVIVCRGDVLLEKTMQQLWAHNICIIFVMP